MSDDPMLDPDYSEALSFDKQICFSLYSASNAMVRAYRPELKALDLTYLQYIVMMVLWEEDGITISALGDKLHLDSGTLTPLLKRLEAKRLLDRKVNAQDERVKQLFLSPAGKKLKQAAELIPEKMLCKTAFPLDQLLALKAQCDGLLKALDRK